MNIEEYRRRKIHTVKLPSGLIIKTKNISPYTSLRIRTEYSKGDKKNDILEPEIIEALFKEFIVSPKIPDEISVEEFDSEDFKAILQAILKHTVLTEGKELEEVVNTDKDFRQ